MFGFPPGCSPSFMSSLFNVRKCGEGAVKKLPANKEPPVSTRTRRATSVPAEKCADTARRERVSPHPPRHIENYISLLSSDEEGTQFQSSGVGRLKLTRKKATGPPPTITSNEGVVTRSRRSTSAPVEKSAMDARLLALDRPSSREAGNPTSPIAGGPINIMGQWERTPPAMLPSLPPTTRGSSAGSLGEILISLSPATSLPTTLTTCTVTTTTCGSPITSTGFTGGVGRQLTSPTCLPQRNVLPTIGEERTSPCMTVTTPPMGGFHTSPLVQPGPSTPEPERGLEERRQEGAASRTPITEGDNQWGGQWTVSVGRRAKRRLQENNRSPSNSESPPTAGPSRSPRIAPLCALIAASTNHHDQSLNVERTYDDICLRKTPPRSESAALSCSRALRE
ncbi:PREDICTED: transcription initiation factor TFIID subunit 12-like [Trachymyrmex cornetzi]|uniref:transcription initiation factor TFIID subunit 12-like n=1 Tax=Trachymyrmex cornetzi TaxID=471704 RepID=UPI00084EDD4B|nr:PREDICTED: transcription initiation factor TFIID subunit 12-like [Trachymyrmex cornetzi]